MNIRKEVNKYPRFVRFIRFIYHDILEGFFNGYYWFMIRYRLSIHNNEVNKLKEMGFEDVIIFKSRTWRIGKGLDKAYRRYYTANYQHNPCFIKIAENDKTIQNEIITANRIKKENWNFTPSILIADPCFMGKRKLLAVSFTDGLHPIPNNITSDNLKILCAQFVQIHESLIKAHLVHADIHRGNLMLNSANHLVLLDFGISKFLNEDNEIDYKARPGTFYKKTEQGRIYDDAYSFLKMIEKLPACATIDKSDEYKTIVNRIGLAQFEVKIN